MRPEHNSLRARWETAAVHQRTGAKIRTKTYTGNLKETLRHLMALQPNSDGLQPTSDGLQPTSDALHPNSDGLNLITMASNLYASNGLQPNSDGPT